MYSPGEGDAEFGKAFLVKKETDGDNGESRFLGLAFELDKFFLL